jgi:Uma2 family endonuclease
VGSTQIIETLASGDRLTQEEFLRRWSALPHIRRAELIGGTVYVMSPTSNPHGKMEILLSLIIGTYAARTKRCEAFSGTTCVMADDVTGPDAGLRLLPEVGGKSRVEDDNYLHGAPEFIAEACFSSAAYDLHEKKDIYARCGVQEYLTVLIRENEIRFFQLRGQSFELAAIPADGTLKSAVFPGLWLNTTAILDGDMARVLDTLEQGIRSPEHDAFVKELATRK